MSRKSGDGVLFCWHLSAPGLLLSSHPARLLQRLLRWSSARCDLFRHVRASGRERIKAPGDPTPRTDITNPASHVSRGAAVKTRAFGEGQAIHNGAGKGSEGAEMATEDPSNAGTAYPGRE